MQENSRVPPANQRLSPDITASVPPYFINRKTPEVSQAGNNNNNDHLCANHESPQFSNTIAEVPPGFYEFVIGDNGEVKILCKICMYVSNKKSNFKRHFTNMHFVHDDDGTRVLECCGTRYDSF